MKYPHSELNRPIIKKFSVQVHAYTYGMYYVYPEYITLFYHPGKVIVSDWASVQNGQKTAIFSLPVVINRLKLCKL